MSARIKEVLAVKAAKLAAKGLRGKALGEKLKVSTDEANTLASIGRSVQRIKCAVFTPSEILLLRSIAQVERRNISRGLVRSPESTEVAFAAGRGASWPAATCKKRLGLAWNPTFKRHDGFGLVNLSGNGYVTLTDLGWMVVQAIEAAEESARATQEGVAA